MSKNTVVYPGTFDPITLGHGDLIARAATLFDRVIVAVAENPNKKTLLAHQIRIELAKEVLAKHTNVEVVGFDGLLVDFANQHGANFILRGLRGATDVMQELPLAVMNRRMTNHLETVFMTPSEQYLALSSSLVREILQYQGDVSEFVDPIVNQKLKNM